MPTVLACTLGGSPAPVISAIRAARPVHVLFIVTTGDGSRAGSDTEVPGVVAASGLGPGAWEQVIVPPDDPDTASVVLGEALRGLRGRFGPAHLLADYTGGTKSMSAALLAAAVELPGCSLQLMTAQRSDLQGIKGGEQPFKINPSWLLAAREAARHRAAWGRFGYSEAAAGVTAILDDVGTDEGAPPGALQRLQDIRDMSAGFAAWDRFAHGEARSILQRLEARHPAFLAPYLAQLNLLCRDDGRGEGARIVDLLLNADRRAERGRYDDAVARCYRLIEWTAQWRLKSAHRVVTKDLPRPEPGAAGRPAAPGGARPSGLMEVVNLLARREPGFARFLADRPHGRAGRSGTQELRELIALRNESILAHETRALGQGDWARFRAFLTGRFCPSVLFPMLAEAQIPRQPPQLPRKLPAGL